MQYRSYFWKKVPFLKLLLAFAGGILVQWYAPVKPQTSWVILAAGLVALAGLLFTTFFHRYRFAFINGIINSFLFFSLGTLLVRQKDTRNDRSWLGNFYAPGDGLLVTLEEPPVEKTRSVKANAAAEYLIRNGQSFPIKGKIIIYFSKAVTDGPQGLSLSYGSQVVFRKPLQEIKNAGNPGGFDYKRYALFQGITHQVYLQAGEFELLDHKKQNGLKKFLYASKEKLLGILRNNIRRREELGLAEALLIGYKQDLDQSLVQSYTNTGVVHIIAISGLHLGLIYWLMALALRPLQKSKTTRWIRAALIISILWVFSLLAGAQPSILRSALMFTCIVLGESLSKKTSIYNTMAVSAFILLCINPFWLWDVGFQLSYAAVLSIIIFMQPIYNIFYIKNKLLDLIWKLNAVTLAAQILTVPLSIYHFHQFPNLFILTNFIAVPLSGIILLGEIFLCVIAFIPAIATLVGQLLGWLIGLMNDYIQRVESIPFSLWNGLQISLVQALLLLLFLVGASYWLMERSSRGLQTGLLALLGFVTLRSLSFLQMDRQQKLIVYNVPRKTAIDIVSGRDYLFAGDSNLLADEFARNFHLKPSRVLHRVSPVGHIRSFNPYENYWSFGGKHILLLNKPVYFPPLKEKPVIDLLILAKNPAINFQKIVTSLEIKQVVFDGSAPAWKIQYWKKDCDSLGIPCHDVTTKGAFVMKLR